MRSGLAVYAWCTRHTQNRQPLAPTAAAAEAERILYIKFPYKEHM